MASHNEHRSPPGPGPFASLRLLSSFRRDPIQTLVGLNAEYGGVVSFKFGMIDTVLVADPEGIQRVLVEGASNYTKDTLSYKKLKLSMGEGLVTSDGELWRKQRRIIQPAFTRERVQQFGTMMTDITTRMLDEWARRGTDREPLEMSEELMRLTLEIIGTTMFSRPMTEFAAEIGEVIACASHYIDQRITSPTSVFSFPERLPTPANRKFREIMARIDAYIFGLIRDRRRAGTEHNDLLSMLLSAKYEETGEGMSDQQLRDEIFTMVVAGHETTSAALMWTFYLLSKNPTVYRKLSEELRAVLGGRIPAVGDLPGLVYSEAVIKESMRLYPPIWLVTRKATADDVLCGFKVRAGTMVMISPYVTHHSLAIWDNPEGFDPERFLGPQAEARHRCAHIPFARGPRQCIGNNFAKMEILLILATIAQRYRFALMPGHHVEPEPAITFRSKYGMRMMAIPVG